MNLPKAIGGFAPTGSGKIRALQRGGLLVGLKEFPKLVVVRAKAMGDSPMHHHMRRLKHPLGAGDRFLMIKAALPDYPPGRTRSALRPRWFPRGGKTSQDWNKPSGKHCASLFKFKSLGQDISNRALISPPKKSCLLPSERIGRARSSFENLRMAALASGTRDLASAANSHFPPFCRESPPVP